MSELLREFTPNLYFEPFWIWSAFFSALCVDSDGAIDPVITSRFRSTTRDDLDIAMVWSLYRDSIAIQI